MGSDNGDRPPIHLGAGEPVLLLHPFLLSQAVWQQVAQRLADTGRYEVFAPTMAGHNGGPSAGTWFLSAAVLADHVERQLDELGWETAHIVGNSLGGWVAFELERRGRARSVTGIAPAGGWTRWSPHKFEVIAKFVLGIPLLLLAWLFGPRVMRLPFRRRLATYAISASPDGLSDAELLGCIDDVAHCPAYFQLLVKAVLLPGLRELAENAVPAHLVFCEKDRIIPAPRFRPAFHHPPAAGPQGHRARGRRAHSDVRGAGPRHRSDQQLCRRVRPHDSGPPAIGGLVPMAALNEVRREGPP
jgi:pimeloyl-ACP methyl ester carboxylesterase